MVVKKCIVCGSSILDYNLFNFPSSEPYRTEWKKFANLTDVADVTRYKLCIRHFSDDTIIPSKQSQDGEQKTKKKRLRKTAIPTLHRECNENRSHVSKKTRTYVCLICKKRSGGTHFKFPRNLQTRNEWLRLSGYAPDFHNGEKDWYLCKAHFSESDLRRAPPNGSTRLRKTAKPTQLLPVLELGSVVVPISEENETTQESSFILPDTESCLITCDNNETTTSSDQSVTEPCASSPEMELFMNCNITSSPIPSDVCSYSPIIELPGNCNNECTPVGVYLRTPFSPVELPNNSTAITSPIQNNSFLQNISSTDILEVINTHKDCSACLTFVEHLPPKHADFSNILTTPTMSSSAVKRRIRYAGDIKSPDLASPNSARRSVNFLKNEVKKYRKKADILNKRNRRLQKIIKTYKSVIDHIKSKGWLSEDGYTSLLVGSSE